MQGGTTKSPLTLYGCDNSKKEGSMQLDFFGNKEEETETELTELGKWLTLEEKVMKHKDNPEVCSPMDVLALEYKHPDCKDRRRGEICLLFIKRFENKVKKKIGIFLERTHSTKKSSYYKEGLLVWSEMVCRKLNQWDSVGDKHGYLNILAYLAPYADQGVVSELHEKHAFKDMRYTSVDTDGGSADVFNSISSNTDAWQAYENSLIQTAFNTNDTIVEGDLMSIVNAVDTNSAVDEIGGCYDGRNYNQWGVMADTHKHNGDIEEIEYLGVKFTPEANVGKTVKGGYDE